MWKTCSRCHEPTNLEDFAKKTKSTDGRQSTCKKCMSKVMLTVYGLDKALWNEKSKGQKGRKREWVNDIKSQATCLVCGEDDPCCLEFHHVDGDEKENTVSVMIANKASDDRIRAEIEKCLILCSNHHRKLHAGRILCVITR